MARAASREALLDLLGPVVQGAGCDLEDLEITPAGKRRLVRVVVDRDGGVPLDVVAQVSTAVSEALDADEPFGDAPYVLEVSSPGVSRPLTQPRHWRRNVGRLVEVVVADGASVVGRITSADDAAVVLDIAGASRTVPIAQLGAGRVQVEFSRPGSDDHIDDDDLDIHDDEPDDDDEDDGETHDEDGEA
ncbi:ribosome maturation factor RimP [Motilibacter peucedani]|uniref:Ribosome maturation factor RimP n=1 Tax=Motilibacter peucedani TaxID=598650 RepID=A0A420XRB6_9ACTN|nr:ribosome maturation factor RimP [Motilibacter peucedani]RKS77392.1 ribosome maturation factor RimP [Motilibacter peucedani]